MNHRLSIILLSVALVVSNSPTAIAETINIPCGGSATYALQMPEGIALNGRECTGILNIDNRVKVIGVEAFKDSKLTSVRFPDDLELISTSAFENTSIKTISIPGKVEIIGESAFAYNNDLTEALLPNSVKSIGAKAFNGTRLRKIVIPNSLIKIESCTFGNIDFGGGSLSLNIPSSVTSIEGCAFWNSGITDVFIPDSIKYLAGFSRNKISTVVIPSSVTTIGMNAFSNNPLYNVQIPDSVTTIEEWAFLKTHLSELVIPSSVKIIKNWAFASNLRLKTVSIPDKLESLGEKVFDDSPSLQAIYYCGELSGFPIPPTCPPERLEIIEKEKAALLAAELKAKQEAEAKAAAELKAKQEAEAKAAAAIKKITLTCIKGKLTKKVTAVKPKCPSGFKVKK
jgi:hypothetical protein